MAGLGSELLFIAVESNAATYSNAATHSEERAGKKEGVRVHMSLD